MYHLSEDQKEELDCARGEEGQRHRVQEGWPGRETAALPAPQTLLQVNTASLLSNPEQTTYKFSARLKPTN